MQKTIPKLNSDEFTLLALLGIVFYKVIKFIEKVITWERNLLEVKIEIIFSKQVVLKSHCKVKFLLDLK